MTIGPHVTLGNGAFRECTRLEHVHLPQGTLLGEAVFQDCIRLKHAEIHARVFVPNRTFLSTKLTK